MCVFCKHPAKLNSTVGQKPFPAARGPALPPAAGDAGRPPWCLLLLFSLSQKSFELQLTRVFKKTPSIPGMRRVHELASVMFLAVSASGHTQAENIESADCNHHGLVRAAGVENDCAPFTEITDGPGRKVPAFTSRTVDSSSLPPPGTS